MKERARERARVRARERAERARERARERGHVYKDSTGECSRELCLLAMRRLSHLEENLEETLHVAKHILKETDVPIYNGSDLMVM